MSSNPHEAKYTEMRGLFDIALPDTSPIQFHKYPGATGDDVQRINAAFAAGITPQQISDDCAKGVLCLGIPLDAYQYASARAQALTGEATIVPVLNDKWLKGAPMPSCDAFKAKVFGTPTTPPVEPPVPGAPVYALQSDLLALEKRVVALEGGASVTKEWATNRFTSNEIRIAKLEGKK